MNILPLNQVNKDFVEPNIIIALYDGWVPKNTNVEKNENKYVKKNRHKSGYTIIKAERLAYHASWNWLMPVFIKIIDKISKEGGYILLKDDVIEINKKKFNEPTLLLSVHKAIIEHIQHGNKT